MIQNVSDLTGACKSSVVINPELGRGIGIERTSVGTYTLKKANSKGEWMKQWPMAQKMVAFNTVYKKTHQNRPRTELQQE